MRCLSAGFKGLERHLNNKSSCHRNMEQEDFQCKHMHSLNESNESVVLDECNVFFRQSYLPNTIINAIFLLLGIVGNSLVIYVYRRKVRKKREDHDFIVVLAIIDLIHCIFSSNLVFIKNSNPLKYTDDISCKILLYGTNVFFILSLLVLVVICVHRYRKICHPLRTQMDKKMKEYAIAGVTISSVVLALPKVIYFKVRKIEVENNLFAYVCGPDMSMFGAKELIQGSTIFLIIMSLILILVMGILYGCVGHVIYKQSKHFKEMRDQSARIKLLFSNLENGNPNLEIFDVDDVNAQKNQPVHPPLKEMISGNVSSVVSSASSIEGGKSSTIKSSKSSRTDTSTLSNRKRSLAHSLSTGAKAHKSSIMFIAITIITILSFIPTWIFVLFDSSDPGRWFRVSNTELQLFLFMRCLHAVGYTANPVIYAYYDRSFRREIKAMFCKQDPLRRGMSSSS